MNEGGATQGQERWKAIKGWCYVCALALFFLLYGLFMFFMVGDKGPPGWDFGTVEDTPGESVYSTNEPVTGGTAAPDPQHISQKPSQADIAAPAPADGNAGKDKP